MELPKTSGRLTYVGITSRWTGRQNATYVMAICECGVRVQVPVWEWRVNRRKQCASCRNQNFYAAGPKKLKAGQERIQKANQGD